MIVINKKLAKEAESNAIASRRVNDISVAKAFLIQANIHLNRVYDKTDYREVRLPRYSEKEFAAAEAIHWLLAYLRRLNCRDIEQLLTDVADYRAQHPDIPDRLTPLGVKDV